MVEAERRTATGDRTETAAARQATQARQATEGEGIRMTRKQRDAFVIGLAQNAILVGLIVIAAGVPTW